MQCSRNYYIFTYTILFSNPMPLDHLLDVRYLIKYGIAYLIKWKHSCFAKISNEVSTDSSEVCQDCFVGKELLVNFLHRYDFLNDVDTYFCATLRFHKTI